MTLLNKKRPKGDIMCVGGLQTDYNDHCGVDGSANSPMF